MGKTLIIKDSDFSNVAVAQVSYVNGPTISIKESGLVSILDAVALKIYYTTDGTEPTSQSTQYVSSFYIDGGTTVKAISLYSDGNYSEVISKTYADDGYTNLTANMSWNENSSVAASTGLEDKGSSSSTLSASLKVDISSYTEIYFANPAVLASTGSQCLKFYDANGSGVANIPIQYGAEIKTYIAAKATIPTGAVWLRCNKITAQSDNFFLKAK